MKHCLERRIKNSAGLQVGTDIINISTDEFTIGRNANASLLIASVNISRNHCTIKNTNGRCSIIDHSTFGTKLNNQRLSRTEATELKDGDVLVLDIAGEFEYTFRCFSAMMAPPAPKRPRLENGTSSTFHSHHSAVQERMDAARLQQSQAAEMEKDLDSSYHKQVEELNEKFNLEREKLENQLLNDQKSLDKQREEMEQRLEAEKNELKSKFENEREQLRKKVEEQKQVEERLKEENEKLLAKMEEERREFEAKLAEERRQMEQTAEEARLKEEQLKAEMESKLRSCMEEASERRQAEIDAYTKQLEQGSEEKNELGDKYAKISEQLKNQELSAAQHMDDKKQLEEQLQQLQDALRAKEEAQNALQEELRRKEEERAKELESLLAQKEAENKRIQEEMLIKEQSMRVSLDAEIEKLQSDKLKLEADIRKELTDANQENKQQYESELAKVQKQLGLMESKKQVLEEELATNNQEKEKLSETCLKEKRKVLEDFGEMMQSELQCHICSELFVVAITLNCTHTFCKHCINEWKRKQTKRVPECPVCRAAIKSENRSIVLDNFIDKMVESLTEDLQEQRRELLIERGMRPAGPTVPSTSKAPAATAGPSTAPAQPQQQSGQRVPPVPPVGAEVQIVNQRPPDLPTSPIPISSDTDPDEEVEEEEEEEEHWRDRRRRRWHESEEEEEENSDDEDMGEDLTVPGLPNSNYGGYGRCYSCGMRGHWAPGCPYNPRARRD